MGSIEILQKISVFAGYQRGSSGNTKMSDLTATFGNTNLCFKPDKLDVYEDNFSNREIHTELTCPTQCDQHLLSIFLLF